MSMANPEEMFVEGFATTANYSYGKSDYIFDFNADGSQAAGAALISGPRGSPIPRWPVISLSSCSRATSRSR